MIVIKRDGTKENFDIDKIQRAVYSAFKVVGKPMPDYLVKMIDSLFSQLEGDAISVEEIQDKIENILMNDKFFDVAKAYILYREKHKQARFIRERIDYMDKYSQSNDNAATSSETDANANVTMKNVANLEGEVYKTTNRVIQRQRMKDKLNGMFPEVAKRYEEDLNHHIIYTHDEATTPVLKQYCMAVSLYPLMMEGVGNIDGIAHQVGVQSFQNGLAGQDLACHSSRVGHAGAADGLHQSLFDDAVLDVQRQLAGALLRCTPAHTVGVAADVLDLIGLDPCALFGDGSRTMLRTFGDRAHILYLLRIGHNHTLLLTNVALAAQNRYRALPAQLLLHTACIRTGCAALFQRLHRYYHA